MVRSASAYSDRDLEVEVAKRKPLGFTTQTAIKEEAIEETALFLLERKALVTEPRAHRGGGYG